MSQAISPAGLCTFWSQASNSVLCWHSTPKMSGKAEVWARERSALPLVSFPGQAWLLHEELVKGHGANGDRTCCSRRPLAPQWKWHLKLSGFRDFG